MIDKTNIENKLIRLIPRLNHEFNVERIGIFGSFITDSFNENSDIDLVVDFTITPGWKYFDLIDFLEMELGYKIDLVTTNALKPQLKDKILSQVKYLS